MSDREQDRARATGVHPIGAVPDGSVPDAEVPAHRRRGRHRIRLAAAALALVAGGTVGGVALGPNLGTSSGDGHEPGFGTVTSQAFNGGQEEPATQPDQPRQAQHVGEGGEAD